MSFIAPLYALGCLAVAIPVLFHFFRRTPRGVQAFSSLMFLRPSAPRWTRRKRIEHWWLLLLRALALLLLVLGFSRPYVRHAAPLEESRSVRRSVAILMDTSASLRRGDLWKRAQAEASAVLEALDPGDDFAVYSFDETLRLEFGFASSRELGRARRIALAKGCIESLEPSWAGSRLGVALGSLADSLALEGDRDRGAHALNIALFSDLQRGVSLEGLAEVEWPKNVSLKIHRLESGSKTRASLTVLPKVGGAESKIRVRVENEPSSHGMDFAIQWEDGDGPVGERVSVSVPPGKTRIVEAPSRAAHPGVFRLSLKGDDEEFDNLRYVAPRSQREEVVLVDGAPGDEGEFGLLYFLEHAVESDPSFPLRIEKAEASRPLLTEVGELPALVVGSRPLEEEGGGRLEGVLERGGTVLYVLPDASTGKALRQWLGGDSLEVTESDGRDGDYAMLGEVDFEHPIFAPFADPRFSDFTKVRFWRHRRVDFEETENLRVLARFDDGDPCLIEVRSGTGRLYVLTSGWHSQDSQLALSTKFVPLLLGMARIGSEERWDGESFRVGERVPLPSRRPKSGSWTIVTPGSEILEIPPESNFFEGTVSPGLYRLRGGGEERIFTVDLTATEGRTDPLALEDLERQGALFEAPTQAPEKRRQMRALELEGRQRLWQWCLFSALMILLIETWLSGRRPAMSLATPEAEKIG